MGLLFKLIYAAILICIFKLRGWVVLAEVGVLRVIAMAGEVATSPKTLPDSGARRISIDIEIVFESWFWISKKIECN